MRTLVTALAVSFISFSAYAFSSGLNNTINERSDIGQFRSLINRTHVVENLPTATYTAHLSKFPLTNILAFTPNIAFLNKKRSFVTIL